MMRRRSDTVTGATILVIAGAKRIRKKCRDCRAPIVLAPVAPKGKYRAFDREPSEWIGTSQDPITRVKFELWPRDLLHDARCRERRAELGR